MRRLLVICWMAVSATAAPVNLPAAEQAPGRDQSSQSIPYKQQPAVEGGSIQRVAWVLLLAIGACFVAAWWLRREFARRGLIAVGSGDRIAVIASRRIAPRLTVFLINVDRQAYVMVQSGGEVRLAAHAAPVDASPEA